MNQHIDPTTRTAHRQEHVSTLVRDMTDILQDRLGLPIPWATAMAQEIVEGMRHKRGGNNIYVPIPDLLPRNERIQQMFTGRNLQEVCAYFGVTKSTVYRACRSRAS